MSPDGTAPPSIPPRRRPSGGPSRPAHPPTGTADSATDTATAPAPSTSPIATAKDSVTTTVKKVAQQATAALMPTTDTLAPPASDEKAAEPMTPSPTATATATAPPKVAGPATSASSTKRTPSTPPPAAAEGAPRRVRLSLSRVDPWSVMKLSFLLSVAVGIMIVVAAAVVWFTLDGLAVFTTVNNLVVEIVGEESGINILQYVEFGRMMSAATLVAVVDVFLLTALSTIGAFLYNITAALVGGVTVTLTDE